MITKLKYGNTNTFLVNGSKKNLLVDTDYAGTLSMFYRCIKENRIKVNDIDYILATHYHPDHIGLVSELMEQGAKLILAEPQAGYVHYSDEIFARAPRLEYKPIDDSVAKIIFLAQSRAFLKDLGIDGEIMQTSSHSEDSISLILDEGTCFVGDLEPFEYLDAYENNLKLKSDWEKIMSYNPKLIYYAHAVEKRL